MSGVQAVVDRGWADPTARRLRMVYGGYMSFGSIPDDRFKAIHPALAFPTLFHVFQSDIHRYMRLFYNEKAPWDNFPGVLGSFPDEICEQREDPTMILHGQSDTRVPIPQSEEFYRAFSNATSVEYVVYPRESRLRRAAPLGGPRPALLGLLRQVLEQCPITEPKEVSSACRRICRSRQIILANLEPVQNRAM